MSLEIIDTPLNLTLYGFSGQVVGKNVGAKGKQLMDAMWQVIRDQDLKHKGINHWVYENHDMLFVGVELEAPAGSMAGLELKKITVARYAYLKHVGPYDKLAESYAEMHQALENQGLQPQNPVLEIYGHWTPDPAMLETGIIISIA